MRVYEPRTSMKAEAQYATQAVPPQVHSSEKKLFEEALNAQTSRPLQADDSRKEKNCGINLIVAQAKKAIREGLISFDDALERVAEEAYAFGFALGRMEKKRIDELNKSDDGEEKD